MKPRISPAVRSHALRWASLGLLSASLAIPTAYAADEPVWNPMALDTSMSLEQAKAQLREADVERAALGYAYALPAFLHMRQRYQWTSGFLQVYGPSAGNPFGQWFLMREPTSPETADPSPNRDTLYGATFLELGPTPYVLSVPDVPKRYWSIAMVDASYYNFEYVGSRTTGQSAANYLIVGPEWQGTAPKGIVKVIRAPTNSITMYQRIWFRDEADVPAVHAIQDGIRLTPLAKFTGTDAVVQVADPASVLAANPLEVRSPVEMYQLVNPYLAANPGPDTDLALRHHVAPVGIGPGMAVPADDEQRAVLLEGARSAQRTLAAMAVAGLKVVNGWQIPPTDVARRGGADGTWMQALVQVRTIGLNVPEEATYYTTYTDGAGMPLTGAKRYQIRFAKGATPPVSVDRYGFWSITLYDREKYLLVANPAIRYLVRSGDPLVYEDDGSLTLYLQPEPPKDQRRRANWLPTPANREFTLNMRVYLGGPTVVAGTYAPPPIEVVR